MIEVTASREQVADALVTELQFLLGTEVFSALSRTISRDFLGDEMDLRTSIIYRPELFERAFIGIIGDIGVGILEHIWYTKLRMQFDLDSSESYQIAGDLAKCIRAIPTKADARLR